MTPRASATLSLLVLLATVGCNSHVENVCQDIGECAQGGSSDWIANCEMEAKALRAEAVYAACGPEFDVYFSCADSNYSCKGATALFPGCADHLTALDSCLARATANTSCVRLEMAEATCTTSRPDAGVGAGTPPACSAARDCQAKCYLASVADVCAPQIGEIQNVSACAASCPP
jgi:hypothetical protein